MKTFYFTGTHTQLKKFDLRDGSRRVTKFLSVIDTFHIKSKAIKVLSCKICCPSRSASGSYIV